MNPPEVYSEAIQRAVNANSFAVSVQHATARPERYLSDVGGTPEAAARADRVSQMILAAVAEGKRAGIRPRDVLLHFGPVKIVPNTVWVTDSHKYRELLRMAEEIIHPLYTPAQRENGVDSILKHESGHLKPALAIPTLTPHFAVTFVETDRRRLSYTAGILWSGECTVSQLLDIVTGPKYLSPPMELSVYDKRSESLLLRAMS